MKVHVIKRLLWLKKDEVNLPQICEKYGNMSHTFILIFCKPNVCLTEPKHLGRLMVEQLSQEGCLNAKHGCM